mmetsp:Transcript_15807/g.23129  ORF Transcript_15807/g.23129 Transcript_15807/m.23129 type:complete len:529 (+) Transcript_15807:108-1694(+)|eukprot:CAMPEP_0197238770 /NCGR_PEP_ID=MMETSP1429-20130617/5292_1 /TAXON_ID=49237 /ORGANISM="Chaetoceros  sp., Strain UNC1202" /LENGTH=528 /DNA_ID=CAMNT_0042698025 /DNA_START=61 /DNA_END=1647 /DNA_ORIENTATION=-
MEEDSNSLLTNLLEDAEKAKESDVPIEISEATPTTGEDQSQSQSQSQFPLTNETVVQEWTRGEKQPPQCRDMPYAIFFLAQFCSVAIYGTISFSSFAQAVGSAPQGNHDDDDDGNQVLHDLSLSAIATVVTTILFLLLSFVVLTRFGKAFITCSLWTSIAFATLLAAAAFATGAVFVGVLCAINAVIGCCYAIAVKKRIPFAAANLNAGVSAIKVNMGVVLISLCSGLILFVWMILWSTSLVGITGAKQVCTDKDADDNLYYGQKDQCSLDVPHSGWVFPWVFFLFWTQQVVSNVIHTTVAGIVSTWYFVPADANGCFSPAVRDSTKRSLTSSFGSICFGSLLVAIIQLLDFIVQTLRRNGRNGDRQQGGAAALLLCCLDCILRLLQDVMEYFNKWAFIYVGVYGYDYLTAGKNVMSLFTHRGWTVVINDNLVRRALMFMSFTVAVFSAMVSLLFVHFDDKSFAGASFTSNFGIALILSFTMMSIIDSSVSTVIVCFGEAPDELEANHQTHNREMREAWNEVYPMVRF